MPARYAISFFLSYVVFIAAVRVWADFVKSERGSGGDWDGTGLDALGSADGEGCLVVLAVLAVALVVAGLFAMTSGLPLLLEVAFEVAFAGVVVRRVSRKLLVGDWLGTLIRNTWLHALVALCVLVTVAALLQAKVPEATTFASAVRSLLREDGRASPGPTQRRRHSLHNSYEKCGRSSTTETRSCPSAPTASVDQYPGPHDVSVAKSRTSTGVPTGKNGLPLESES